MTDNYSISYELNTILDGYQKSSDNSCPSAIYADVGINFRLTNTKRDFMNITVKIKNTWSIIFITLALLFTSSLLHAESITGGKAVITALNSEWNKAFNSSNPESVAALYDENAILSPGNGEVLVGRVAIEGLFRSFIENGVYNHTIEVIDIHHDDKTMYEVSKWSAHGVEKDGTKPVFGGILVNVFHIDHNGEWKSHLHIWNTSS